MWDYHPIEKFLIKKNRPVEFFKFEYAKRFGEVSIKNIAADLKQYIENNIKSEKFYVIGFSQGGIIWRTFAVTNPEISKRALAAFTICTPHQGSLSAYLGLGNGIADLRPHSALLKELDGFDDTTPYYAVHNPFDSFVIPGSNAIFAKAKINLAVPALLHASTF